MSKKEKKKLRYMRKEKPIKVEEIEKVDIRKYINLAQSAKNKNRKAALKGKAYLKKQILKKQKKEDEKYKSSFNLTTEKQTPQTIERLAIFDENKICEENEKYLDNEKCIDEFSDYFKNKVEPNIVITSIKRPSKKTILFMKELALTFPNIFYEPRHTHSLDFILKNAIENNFTSFILIEEGKDKLPKYFYICTLPYGPTSKFLINNIRFAHKKKVNIEITNLHPEIYISNFNTFIGERIKRQLHTLVPFNPQYKGQKVVVFYNQRDFIFFRHYKYNFESFKQCNLTEIGPGFTLQLLNIKDGLINDKEKMYEFILRPDMKVNRKRMYL